MADSREFAFLESISEFSDFLGSADHDLACKLKHMSRVVFKTFGITQAAFIQLVDNDFLAAVERLGMSDEERLVQTNIVNLSMDLPVCLSIRENRIIWLNSLPNWGEDFPQLKSFKVNPEDKLYFCIPVMQKQIPSAVLTFRSKLVIDFDSEIESFLRAISSVFSLYHFRNITVYREEQIAQSDSAHESRDATYNELTERQNVILRLIAEDRTNQSISNFLGYSESTIRQEIMRIFDKLDCSSRSQAATIYRKNQLVET